MPLRPCQCDAMPEWLMGQTRAWTNTHGCLKMYMKVVYEGESAQEKTLITCATIIILTICVLALNTHYYVHAHIIHTDANL